MVTQDEGAYTYCHSWDGVLKKSDYGGMTKPHQLTRYVTSHDY